MPTYTANYRTLETLLDVMRAKLVTDTTLNSTHVRYSVEDPPRYIGERCLLLRPRKLETDPEAGAGPTANPTLRILTVRVCSRVALGAAGDADSMLFDASLGHILFEEQVALSLHHFYPANDDGLPMFLEPMRLVPEACADCQTAKADKAWVESVLGFEFKYLPQFRVDNFS